MSTETVVPEILPIVSRNTEITLLEKTLEQYKNGLDDGGQLAAFVLDNPNVATKAVTAYVKLQEAALAELDRFMRGDRDDTTKLERRWTALCRKHGLFSKPPVPRVVTVR